MDSIGRLGCPNNILKVLHNLDEELSDIGGKIYLAKDLRMSSEIFKKLILILKMERCKK